VLFKDEGQRVLIENARKVSGAQGRLATLSLADRPYIHSSEIKYKYRAMTNFKTSNYA